MKIEKTEFGGWANCLRIANDHAELIVTLDVGPRIISYQHLPGGKNVLKTNAEELGKSGEDHFVPRGGHRIWLAPEDERTYLPDNIAGDITRCCPTACGSRIRRRAPGRSRRN